SLEQPQRGPYLRTLLGEYTLRLYGTRAYLEQNPPIRNREDLEHHRYIGYVEELLFSDDLRYLDDIVPAANVGFRSTSVIAQYHAALQGNALAILPCFMAAQDPRLITVLEDEIQVSRRFWMYCHEDLRQSRRVMALWDCMKRAAQLTAPLLQRADGRLRYLPWFPLARRADPQFAPHHIDHQGSEERMHQPDAGMEVQLAMRHPAARQIDQVHVEQAHQARNQNIARAPEARVHGTQRNCQQSQVQGGQRQGQSPHDLGIRHRSEEHTSELQSRVNLVYMHQLEQYKLKTLVRLSAGLAY